MKYKNENNWRSGNPKFEYDFFMKHEDVTLPKFANMIMMASEKVDNIVRDHEQYLETIYKKNLEIFFTDKGIKGRVFQAGEFNEYAQAHKKELFKDTYFEDELLTEGEKKE